MTGGTTARIAVIGAGIVGISCALHLLRLGKQVVLIDRDDPGEGASAGNAGVLACCAVVPVATPGILLRAPGMLFGADGPLFLRWSYLPRLLPWLIPYLGNSRPETVEHIARHLAPLVIDSVREHQELAADTPAARWIRPSSYMYVYRDRRAYDRDAFAWDLRRRQGIDWRVVEGDEVRSVEPALSPAYRCAAVLADHAHIADPGRYIKDLAAAVVGAGGDFLRAEVRNLRPEGGGVVLETGGADVAADAAVVAAGAWSAALAARLGADVPLESERGYHLDLVEPSVRPAMPVMDAARKFVVTPQDQGLRLAGILELGGLSAPASDGPFKLLLRGARSLLPGLEYAAERRWFGHRPATVDSLPVIGRSPRCHNVFFAYGHHHVGLTAGPKTGRLVARQVVGLQPDLDLEAYRPDRCG